MEMDGNIFRVTFFIYYRKIDICYMVIGERRVFKVTQKNPPEVRTLENFYPCEQGGLIPELSIILQSFRNLCG